MLPVFQRLRVGALQTAHTPGTQSCTITANPPPPTNRQLLPATVPLICLHSAEFFFLSLPLSLCLLRPHPLSKQSNPGHEHWPLSKARCCSLTPQAPCSFSYFYFLFIILFPFCGNVHIWTSSRGAELGPDIVWRCLLTHVGQQITEDIFLHIEEWRMGMMVFV